MTLTRKIVLAVLLAAVVYLILDLWLVNKVIGNAFEKEEARVIEQNRARVKQALDGAIAQLTRANLDWAQWTDTYDFVSDRNARFVAENLGNASLVNINVDLVALFDREGRLVTGRFRKPGEAEFGVMDDKDLQALRLRDEVDVQRAVQGEFAGIVTTPEGKMFVSAGEVLHSDLAGPSNGALVFGRFVELDWMSAALKGLQVDFAIVQAARLSNRGPKASVPATERVKSGWTESIGDTAFDYVPYPDLSGRPQFLLEIQTPRIISAHGRQIQQLTALSIIAGGIVFIIAVALLLGGLVARPIRQLAEHIAEIRKTGRLAECPGIDRGDEIGRMANQFNSLMAEHRAAIAQIERQATALEQSSEAIIIAGSNGLVEYVNPAYLRITGFSETEVLGSEMTARRADGSEDEATLHEIRKTIGSGSTWSGSFYTARQDGSIFEEEAAISPIRDRAGKIVKYIAVRRDVTEQRRLQRELGQTQKLQSMGQLAAGIAHEINTPTQYVSDNIRFLQDAFGNLGKLLHWLTTSASSGEPVEAEALNKALEEADAEYLLEEIPEAIEQSREGVGRVSKIVSSMKEFSHPARRKVPSDLNRALSSTITIATSEWKYIADVEMELDETLPPVPCLLGDFNQVILNMIVNAAHAIAGRADELPEGKGVIRVSTSHDEEWVQIRIADNGTGMTEDVKARIFDPFFTTKEVGRGTGQGLNIGYQVIVEKHGGAITVHSTPGHGTCFDIRLPILDTGAVEAKPERARKTAAA